MWFCDIMSHPGELTLFWEVASLISPKGRWMSSVSDTDASGTHPTSMTATSLGPEGTNKKPYSGWTFAHWEHCSLGLFTGSQYVYNNDDDFCFLIKQEQFLILSKYMFIILLIWIILCFQFLFFCTWCSGGTTISLLLSIYW